jgi:ATP-dependent DNA helicase RecQ
MQASINDILKQYWGYDSFRPKQEDIINSVLLKQDTIALLPTGGGKSICYQVPTLVNDGMTIVISPLIALMKDQIEALNARNITAIALTSELDEKETDIELDKCVYGETKFLYISPEKLKNELVKTRISLMNVNLIAVDEAHCISQWGHDFRPSYLEISTIRQIIPNTPILALTATATNLVLKDISKFLELTKFKTYQTSFKRDNLSFWVLKEEDKFYRLFQTLNKVKGSAIIYVRNRRKTKEISDVLNHHNISSTFYHAGIEKTEKTKRQQQWMNNNTRVMVSTNAFGMGIDKSNVSLVIHMDLPDSPEAYFQEAGRAGRDGNKAFAIMIFNDNDVDNLKSFHLSNLANRSIVSNVLSLLYRNYRIANNTEDHNLYDFNLAEFVFKNNLNFIQTYNAINILSKEDIISVTNASSVFSKVKFIVNNDYIFDYKERIEYLGIFATSLLRSYGGITDDYVRVNEFIFAARTQVSQQLVRNNLLALKKDGIIKYQPSKKGQQLKFLIPRNEKYTIGRISKSIEVRNTRIRNRIEAMISYAGNSKTCRNQQMLKYFDQEHSENCGFCDVCITKKNKIIYSENIEKSIIVLLKQNELSSREISSALKTNDNLILKAISYLLEEGKIEIRDNNKYALL